MSDEPLQVSVKILEKEYRIACDPHEQDDLKASARLLDHRMREIRQNGRVIGTDRIAVMAGLNIAHDLIQLQRAQPDLTQDSGRRLRELQDRLSMALAEEPAVVPSVEPPLDASNERV
ncbi:cell division protein ZapA [uncultured Thiocystis sp.]|uniref:cell division protein ZapA n=1 Tax=uncultured Thiocystis sp. TaxID=1202134 RepID=UPI0025D17107|nr:cell division protein ZapA [uncultured Thiocystis sp.]